jgi:trans-2,3-dihydro-3-hydroxyanthranilate isomerase
MTLSAFYIVDVFAEEKYAGNQLAVFSDGQAFNDDQMQKLAREMHFSETTFIMSHQPRDGRFDVRIFTPEHEVPFAGHPTLGTAFILQSQIIKEPIDRIVLNLGVGPIPVDLTYDGGELSELWMKQVNPIFGEILSATSLAKTLGLRESDIDPRFPIQEVSTGMGFIIVPLKNLDALKRAAIARERYFQLISALDSKGILVFSPETHHVRNDLAARVFVDYYGVPEDPATGSGNGCLAGYLARYDCLRTRQVNVRVEQGYEIHRPSLLYLKAEETASGIDVHVGGRVSLTASAELA